MGNNISILRITLLSIILLSGAGFAFEDAFAATVTWDGGGGDNLWSNQDNWTGDILPTNLDDVTINQAVSLDIDFNVDSSLTILEGGSLTILDATLTNNAVMNISGGVMTITSVGTFVNTETLTVNGA